MLLECLDDTVAQCRLDKASQGCMSIITVTHIRAALQAILNMCHASLYVTHLSNLVSTYVWQAACTSCNWAAD